MIDKLKPALLIFEGPDKAGKTTIRHEIHKLTNKFLIWDRGMASHHVYGEVLKKLDTPPIENLLEMENKMLCSNMDTYYVYIYGDTETLIERMKDHKEDEIFTKNIREVKVLYSNYFDKTKVPVIAISTTNGKYDRSIRDCIQEIFEKIEFKQRELYKDWSEALEKTRKD